MLASRRRHDTVILRTPPTGNSVCSSHEKPDRRTIQVWPETPTVTPSCWPGLLHCTIKWCHNSQLLGKGSRLYGCWGNEAQSATAGVILGTPGYLYPCHPLRLRSSTRLHSSRRRGLVTTSPPACTGRVVGSRGSRYA